MAFFCDIKQIECGICIQSILSLMSFQLRKRMFQFKVFRMEKVPLYFISWFFCCRIQTFENHGVSWNLSEN